MESNVKNSEGKSSKAAKTETDVDKNAGDEGDEFLELSSGRDFGGFIFEFPWWRYKWTLEKERRVIIMQAVGILFLSIFVRIFVF